MTTKLFIIINNKTKTQYPSLYTHNPQLDIYENIIQTDYQKLEIQYNLPSSITSIINNSNPKAILDHYNNPSKYTIKPYN